MGRRAGMEIATSRLVASSFLAILVASGPGLRAQQEGSPSDLREAVSGGVATQQAQPLQPERVSASSLPTPAPVPPEPVQSSATRTSADSDAAEDSALSANAQDPLSRELQGIVLQALQNLDEERLPDLEQAKLELRNAIFSLENYVGLSTQRGQAWNKFLRLEEIKDELDKDRPSIAKFTDYEMSMRQNYQGLEYAPFLRVRNALNQVVRALKYGANPERTIQILNARMEALVESLNERPDGAEAERSSDVGLVTNYLAESGQAPVAVAQILEKYRVPNVQIYARENLLNRLLMRPVAEPSPVNECLLGTRVIGRACLRGSLSVDVLPMHGGVALDLNMSATMNSVNSGYNRGVVLRSTGSSPVFASKRVIVTPSGVSSQPATVATNLMSNIYAIEHRLRIVRRIARRKAAEQKPQVDAIAQGRLQRRIRDRYDNQVNQELAQAGGRLSELKQRPRPEFERLNIPRPMLAVYSTDNTVNANVVQAASFQLAASKPCTISRPRTSDVVVELHQSVVVNTLESLLGGRTIHNHDLDDLAEQILGEVPPEVMTEVNGDPWEITMAAFNPVQLEFDDNQVKLTLRISRMEGKDRSLGRGAIISATYDPSFRGGVLTLRRAGDLEIEVPGVRSTFQATNLRSVVKAKFDPIFEEEIVTERLDVTQFMPNAPDFKLDWIKLDDGWAQVGVR